MGKTQFVTQFFLKGITCVATGFSLLVKKPLCDPRGGKPTLSVTLWFDKSMYYATLPKKDEIYVGGHIGMGGYLTLSLTSLKIGPLGMRLGPTITARNSSFSRATR